jgi:hypothetical protein
MKRERHTAEWHLSQARCREYYARMFADMYENASKHGRAKSHSDLELSKDHAAAAANHRKLAARAARRAA